jgi:drug/metabolite transporter (DMT)-like permease
VLTNELPVTRLFHTALWVFAALSLWVLPQWQPMSGKAWIALGFVGACGFLGLYALDTAVDAGPPEAIVAVLYMQPLLSAALELATRHDPLRRSALLGALLVMLAVFATVRVGSGRYEVEPA